MQERNLQEGDAVVVPGRSAIGGGSLPGETLPSWVLSLNCRAASGGPEGVMERLRQEDTPVIARIEEDRVLLDPRTVLPEEDEVLLQGVRAALAR
jgi:L-seryl-tRNA(Ser) seleniumtransferase